MPFVRLRTKANLAMMYGPESCSVLERREVAGEFREASDSPGGGVHCPTHPPVTDVVVLRMERLVSW